MFLPAMIAFVAFVPEPSQPPTPVTYASYVGQSRGRCRYSTGDVILNAAQFEEDLRERFDRAANMIVFHDSAVPPSCLRSALSIAHRVGFRNVREQVAPPELNMGPPR